MMSIVTISLFLTNFPAVKCEILSSFDSETPVSVQDWHYFPLSGKFYGKTVDSTRFWNITEMYCKQLSFTGTFTQTTSLAMPKSHQEIRLLADWINFTETVHEMPYSIGLYQDPDQSASNTGWKYVDGTPFTLEIPDGYGYFDDFNGTILEVPLIETNQQNCGRMVYFAYPGFYHCRFDDGPCVVKDEDLPMKGICELVPSLTNLIQIEEENVLFLMPLMSLSIISSGNQTTAASYCKNFASSLNASTEARIVSTLDADLVLKAGERISQTFAVWSNSIQNLTCFAGGFQFDCPTSIFILCSLNETEVEVESTNSGGIAAGVLLSTGTLILTAIPVVANSIQSTKIFPGDSFSVTFEHCQSFAAFAFLNINYPTLMKSFVLSSIWTLGFLPFNLPDSKCSSNMSPTLTFLSQKLGFESSCDILLVPIILYVILIAAFLIVFWPICHLILKNVKKKKAVQTESSWKAIQLSMIVSSSLLSGLYFSSFGLFAFSTYTSHITAATLMLAVTGIALPAIIFTKLSKFQNLKSQYDLTVKFSIITSNYELGKMYFAIFDLLLKLLICLVSVIRISGIAQSILLALINLSLLAASIYIKPYKQDAVVKQISFGIRILAALLLLPFAINEEGMSASEKLAIQVVEIFLAFSIIFISFAASVKRILFGKVAISVSPVANVQIQVQAQASSKELD